MTCLENCMRFNLDIVLDWIFLTSRNVFLLNFFPVPQRFYSLVPHGLRSGFSSKNIFNLLWGYLTERNVLCIVDTSTHDRSFMYRHWHISFLPRRTYLWINSCYQVDVSVLCIAGDVMLLIILVLRVISGCSHPLRLTFHFLHPGLIHVIFLFASNPKYFSSIHVSVSIGLVMA